LRTKKEKDRNKILKWYRTFIKKDLKPKPNKILKKNTKKVKQKGYKKKFYKNRNVRKIVLK